MAHDDNSCNGCLLMLLMVFPISTVVYCAAFICSVLCTAEVGFWRNSTYPYVSRGNRQPTGNAARLVPQVSRGNYQSIGGDTPVVQGRVVEAVPVADDMRGIVYTTRRAEVPELTAVVVHDV